MMVDITFVRQPVARDTSSSPFPQWGMRVWPCKLSFVPALISTLSLAQIWCHVVRLVETNSQSFALRQTLPWLVKGDISTVSRHLVARVHSRRWHLDTQPWHCSYQNTTTTTTHTKRFCNSSSEHISWFCWCTFDNGISLFRCLDKILKRTGWHSNWRCTHEVSLLIYADTPRGVRFGNLLL